MESMRTYGDACAVASALDLIGDRWALLIVRELLFGPKRFSDLRTGLPRIAPNRLSQRLRDLEEYGVVRRRTLGPTVGAQVFALSEWGRDFEGVLGELGQWGRRSPFRDLDAHLSVDSLMLALSGDVRPLADTPAQVGYELRFGNDRIHVHVAGNRIEVTRHEGGHPDVAVDTDVRTFTALLTRAQSIPDAVEAGRLAIKGDPGLLQQLLDAVPRPEPAADRDSSHTVAQPPGELR
ncbi:MAG: transcriptional regulator [Mycobacteriaceae bacterium]|nr:transcriptional regulator [Mycobacteriaceae bacterium]